MIYNIQAHLNPRWCLVIDQDTFATFWKNLTRKFAVDLSLQILLIHYISRYGYDEAFQSPIWQLLLRIWLLK